MNFDQKLENYAILLVQHGLNIQPGQVVNIAGEVIHRDLMRKVAEKAYKRGARFVNIDLIDPWHMRDRILKSTEKEYFQYVPPFVPAKYNELVDTNGAALRFQGSEEPDCLSDLSPEKINTLMFHYRQSLKRYYEEGVGKSKVQWTVAAASTPKWGKKLFPHLNEKEAYLKLWDEIFHICRVDRSDFLELWEMHNETLQNRAKKLTDLQIEELHFLGPGTDLKVKLSQKALFLGGCAHGARGVPYECNIPTEECFTTPDYRGTTGKAKVTRPFLVNGKLIKGLTLEFLEGKIIHFDAEEGKETFSTYIQTDKGACQLGEVALVGIDSPIFQSGHIFEEILFDENAACHIAVGFAYPFCLKGGEQFSSEEKEKSGCNVSNVHTDMMISNEQTDVYATTWNGKKIPLILKGNWQPF